MGHVSICAVFRDEAPYLLEWLAYHFMIGVGHFYLYDNNSSDGGAALLMASPFSSRITLIDWPKTPGQLSAYQHYCDYFGDQPGWTAFIDLDEFLVPLDGGSLGQTLEKYQHFAGILVQWLMFGPSGFEEPPAGLVIENYKSRFPDGLEESNHIKSIIRNGALRRPASNPHVFLVAGPVCDADGREVPNEALQQRECHEKIVLHHYFTKSRRDWNKKLQRGKATTNRADQQYARSMFEQIVSRANFTDDRLIPVASVLRALLGACAY